MADLRATEQNRLLGVLADLLRGREQTQAQIGSTGMGALMDLILPSSRTVEKWSYGDPLFRMPQQSNIPITADKEYLAETLASVPMAGGATTKLSNRAADELVRLISRNPEATAPAALEAAGQLAPISSIYRKSTPKRPDPEIGTRFEREFLGGLADKTPVKIEDLKGSSAMIMPWDSTSRNYKITSVSEEKLPVPVVTHGGQDYARDLEHISQNVAGASNLGIAKRIRDRDTQARSENLAAGGTGKIVHIPVTMGEGSENFSVMPTEILVQMLDRASPSKKFVQDLDKSVREFPIVKGKGEKKRVTYPFKNFKGVMSEEGRMQLYTGEGIDSTAGELRKALVNRASLKENQQYLGYNIEDLSASLTDPALSGVEKGMVGNTLIGVDETGMHLKPAQNPTYSTNFTGQYLGSLGNNVPVEVLFPRLSPQLSEEFAGRQGDIRNMVLGALEKRKEGISELIDQQVIDNYYNYLEKQRGLGLLD